MKRYYKLVPFCVIVVFFIHCNSVNRASSTGNAAVTLSAKDDLISGRLFPVFRNLNQQPGLAARINESPQQKMLADSITNRYRDALKNCRDLKCLADAFIVKESESQQFISIAEATDLKKEGKGRLKANDQRAHAAFQLAGNPLSLKEALEGELQSVNYIFDVYVSGDKPRYPRIDGPARLTNERAYFNDLQHAVRKISEQIGSKGSFYHLPWLTAIKVLELNGRDEAARYEPIKQLNSAAIKRVKSVDWNKYKYSTILVPGLGPRKAGVALDPGGAKRCDMAAAQYKKGLAPFIMVSGGHVHPDQTPYSEAIEMRKYLVGQLGIPAEAVIAEPYARHTTTNIRNAARLVIEFGIPAKMPVLIVTDIGQSAMIMFMKGRFMDELGYLPYEELSRTRSGEPYFIPSPEALRLNPMDPLDP